MRPSAIFFENRDRIVPDIDLVATQGNSGGQNLVPSPPAYPIHQTLLIDLSPEGNADASWHNLPYGKA